MDIADTLLKAADVIEERGHTKGVLEDADGRVCAVGAFNRVVGGYYHKTANTLSSAVVEYLGLKRRYTPVTIGTLVDWNNAPERTQQEVVDAFRGTARALKAQEAEQIEIPEETPVSEQVPA